MQIRLDGRVALVTGASGGIGSEVVNSLHEAGCIVVGTDIVESPPQLLERTKYRRCDITDQASRIELVAFCKKEYGRLDILVNVAGVAYRVDFFDTTIEMWDKIMEVNLKSYFFLSQAAAAVMKDQERGGSIVNMASIGGSEVAPENTAAYGTSKGGVRALTFMLAGALGPLGIRVNAVAPGTIETSMNKARWDVPGVRERAASNVPARRLGKATDIGPLVVYLCSDQASFMTGSVVVIDGGRSHVTI